MSTAEAGLRHNWSFYLLASIAHYSAAPSPVLHKAFGRYPIVESTGVPLTPIAKQKRYFMLLKKKRAKVQPE